MTDKPFLASPSEGDAVERNRYFTGKYMAPRDFMADPEYLLARHRMHNRLLHGWGIVSGLQVRRHEEHPDRCVRVTRGVAVDERGREVLLLKDEGVELPVPRKPEDEREFYVCLQYSECPVEYLPLLYHEKGCRPGHDEANRVREVARIRVLTEDEFRRVRHRDHVIPLARIEFRPHGGQPDGKPFRIDRGVRRYLRGPGQLTHITAVNWRHGGEIALRDLDQVMDRRLAVRFDRRIQEADGDRRGINAFTFVVQYGNLQNDLEFLSYETAPYLSDDERTAVFVIDSGNFRPNRNLRGSDIFVTLKCDFILDCDDNPVDGNHLRGRRPTGNGLPGGTFESWFRVE